MSFDKKKKKRSGGGQEMEMQDLVPVTVNAIPTAEKKEETESCTVELFLWSVFSIYKLKKEHDEHIHNTSTHTHIPHLLQFSCYKNYGTCNL